MPTRETVEEILFEDLPERDGDLLWIYWAGHGYVDDSHQLLLPYVDARRRRTLHLNLESALRWWKASGATRGRFSRQIAITDACRVDSRSARGLVFPQTGYGARPPDPKRRQFALYAAHEGEPAKNLADQGAGQFTHTLLRRLNGTTMSASVHQLVDIARSVQADFQDLRTQGLAWQEPQFLIDRDWSGSTIFGDRWADPDTAGPTAPRLDQCAWTDLGHLLRGQGIPAHTYDAYRWAFQITGCAAPAHQGLPPGDALTDIAIDLDNRQGRPDMPLTLPFIRHLAAHTSDKLWAEKADAWVDTTRARMNSVPIPPPPEGHPESVGLHVQITDDEEAHGTHWARMWLYRDGGFQAVWEADQPLSMDAIRTSLADQLLQRRRGEQPRRIEFHVPYELLSEPFECWRLPIGRRCKPIELGCSYEVIVRCPDEREGVAGEHWHRKWQWLKSHGGHHPKAVHELSDADICEALDVVLQATEPPVCVLAEVSEQRLMDALAAVLDAGVPIAVWPRHVDGMPQPGQLAATLADTHQLDVARLPAVIKTLRTSLPGASAAGAQPSRPPLALMWDDPDRVPERRPLS
ncbi:hypothetical protein [Streptomyces sp. NPDC029004]|uniref:VMAP-C domain-containing protein n=1 Tax=Streptomyces sp. NPDC029004 TaxID=3154490 RepID=UPI00340B5470